MKNTILVLSMLVAASAHANTPGAEVYAATEGGMAEPVLNVHGTEPVKEESSDDAHRAAETAPAPVPAQVQVQVQAQAQTQAVPKPAVVKEAYDPVPSDQKGALSIRLKLVEAIIQKHGRAYDYRIHTVRELEALLQRLDSAEKSSSKS